MTREAPSNDSCSPFLVDVWEQINGAESVQTTAEVYDGIREEGYAVEYHRVPVTDGTPPEVGVYNV